MYAVVLTTGELRMSFYGPFKSYEEADTWAYKEGLAACDYWIVKLEEKGVR